MIAVNFLTKSQSWTQKANFPTINTEAKGFSLNGKGYVYGGSINKNLEYDPISDTWTEKNPIPIKGIGGVAFVVGNKAYVGMFNTSSGINDSIFEYDPITDSYAFKTLFPGNKSSNSVYPASFVINNKAYITLGNYTPGELWEYDPSSNQWNQKASPPYPLSNSNRAAFAVNGKGYLCISNSLIEYDPISNSWTNKASLPSSNSRSGHVAFTIGNFAFVGAGSYLSNSFRDFYKYNPITNTWTSIDSLPIGSSNAVTFTIGNKGYYVLGVNGFMNFQTKTWEYYDPTIPSGTIEFDIMENENFQIFPNPSQGSFYIQSKTNGMFELTDITGKTLKTFFVTNEEFRVTEKFPAGVYFIRNLTHKSKTLKLIIE